MSKFAKGKTSGDLLVLLKETQRKDGCVSEKAMTELADSLEMTRSDVYGVTTFYSFLSIKPRGRNIIRICKSLPCHLKNYESVAESIENELGIKPGETTKDGRFTLELTNCIGACDVAPAMLINDEVHGNLTPKTISKLLGEYK
ncbi:NADH-quinone oxidoreductase subunit NuoE [Chloroflexota bacterium]